jgi:POT family proton-dependent oligopeptide transporter
MVRLSSSARKMTHANLLTVVQKPTGSVLVKATQVLWLGLKGGRNLDAAKPSALAQTSPGTIVPWDDEFVQELKRALVACTVLWVFTALYVSFQATNNVRQLCVVSFGSF